MGGRQGGTLPGLSEIWRDGWGSDFQEENARGRSLRLFLGEGTPGRLSSTSVTWGECRFED